MQKGKQESRNNGRKGDKEPVYRDGNGAPAVDSVGSVKGSACAQPAQALVFPVLLRSAAAAAAATLTDSVASVPKGALFREGGEKAAPHCPAAFFGSAATQHLQLAEGGALQGGGRALTLTL